MEEMAQKQARKRGLKGLASGKSKGQIELAEKAPQEETLPSNPILQAADLPAQQDSEIAEHKPGQGRAEWCG